MSEETRYLEWIVGITLLYTNSYFPRFRRHHLIQPRLFVKVVEEREDGVAIHNQPFTLAGMRHIGELVWRNVEEFGENCAVARGLVQQQNEVAVFKDVLGLLRVEQVFHVLRDRRRDAAPLAEALPNLRAVGGGDFVLEQQMKLVDVVARRPLLRAVSGHAPPNMILNDVHGERLELGAGLLRVETDEAVLHIHIRAVVEEIECAVHIGVDGLCHIVRVLVAIGGVCVANLNQRGVQVGQRRHIIGSAIGKIAGIHRPRRFLDHGLLPEGKRAGTDDDLEQRHEKIDLERNRVVAVAIVRVDVHGVDAFAARRRNADHLPVQLAHQRRIFALGITNDHIVACQDEHDEHLAFRCERLAAAGRAEDQPVRVFVKKNFFITGNISRFDML